MNKGLVDLVCVNGIVLRVPGDYYFSFANSPYYAHKWFKAVDVYPPRGEELVLSPFTGKLIYYRVVGGEHVLGFRVGDHYVRVLHVKPLISIGEEVEVGEALGELVDSPFFHYWTDKHMHLEIRLKPEFLRASGGVRLSLCRELVYGNPSTVSQRYDGLRGILLSRIVFYEPRRYVLAEPLHQYGRYTTPLTACSDIGYCGFIDGGIPHYGHGILVVGGNEFKGYGRVLFGETLLGEIDDYYGYGLHHFNVDKKRVRIFVNNTRVKGLGLYMGDPYLKIIPLDWRDFPYREGDLVEIRISDTLVEV